MYGSSQQCAHLKLHNERLIFNLSIGLMYPSSICEKYVCIFSWTLGLKTLWSRRLFCSVNVSASWSASISNEEANFLFLVDEFPNTNANLIPIGNIKSQVDKGINFKIFKVTISSNFNTHTNPFISSIKRKLVNKSLLILLHLLCFLRQTQTGFILKNTDISRC